MRTIDLRDPVDIERLLVWTYRDQRADVVIGLGMRFFEQEAAMDGRTRYATSTDGITALQRVGALGTRVDGGGASAAALHPDAEVVHDAVMMLDRHLAMMVIEHARASSRPDQTAIVPPRAHPVLNRLDRPTVRYDGWDSGRHYGWCPVDWTVAPTTAEVVRLEYATWRRALLLLTVALSRDGRLARHRAMAPAAPRAAALRYG